MPIKQIVIVDRTHIGKSTGLDKGCKVSHVIKSPLTYRRENGNKIYAFRFDALWQDPFDISTKTKKQEMSSLWFLSGIHYPEDKDKGELLKKIQSRLGIDTEESKQFKDQMFQEIDQLTEKNQIDLLSDEEKEQFILAVVKTADYLAKKTLELKP